MKNLWRHILKNKIYAFINLFGLTLGLTVCTLILLYVQDETSYDTFLPGYDHVIRIQPAAFSGDDHQEWATSEGFVVPALMSMYPEIESGTRFILSNGDIVFRKDSTAFAQEGVIAADEKLFDVFPFEFIHGDRLTALKKPNGIVLAAEVARKFFGNDDPIGKVLATSFGLLQVTGVFRDIPASSHFHFKAAFPLRIWIPDADQSRTRYMFYSYLRMKSADRVRPFIEEKLKGWYAAHGYAVDEGQSSAPPEVRITLGALPIADIHLKSHAEKEYEANNSSQIIWIFIAVASLIMVIATINYINLSNAMAIHRAKEVAIRKTIGASRQKLFLLFMAESYAFTLVAFIFSIIIVGLLLINGAMPGGKPLDLTVLKGPWFLSIAITAWLVLGFLSGFYPATVLSSFQPIQALRSNIRGGKSNRFSLNLRRGLIVFQFAISVFMIICAFTIRQQMHFIETRNLGFNKNNVVAVPLLDDARPHSITLKNEIARLPAVESVAISSVVPGQRVVYLTVRIPDLAEKNSAETTPDGTTNMRVMSVDHNFVKTLGLQITEGRDLSLQNAADAEGGFLLNEAAVKAFGLHDPIGRPFEYVFGHEPKKGKIIGVVKDFHFASIHSEVEPLMMHYDSLFFGTLSIRLKSGDVPEGIAQIESVWKETVDVPFSYQFLDTSYDMLYRSERVTSRVMTGLTVVALLIACLGLFGIVSFFVVQRTREVGIRKVFGATPISLFGVLSYEYVVMVIVGNAVAIYPAWSMSLQWLQQFSYRADISWLIFAVAFLVSSLLALLSIAYVIIRTSKANPAVILRSE